MPLAAKKKQNKEQKMTRKTQKQRAEESFKVRNDSGINKDHLINVVCGKKNMSKRIIFTLDVFVFYLERRAFKCLVSTREAI